MRRGAVIQNWHTLKDKIQKEWGKLKEADIEEINGDRDRLLIMLQDKYGFNEVEAEEEVSNWEDELLALAEELEN